MSTEPLRIVRLTAENFKRLSAVEITPGDADVFEVCGKNGAGKTSVLDAIEAALGGKGSVPKVPIRRGEESAKIVLDLGDVVVRRTFTKTDSYLSVENAEGATFKSPQGILDALYGHLSFSPLDFMEQRPAKQRATLMQIAGLDFADIDEERLTAFAERTDVNRDGKALAARLDGMPLTHADTPAEETSAGDVIAELDLAGDTNRANTATRQAFTDADNAFGVCERAVETQQAAVKAAVNAVEEAKAELRKADAANELARREADAAKTLAEAVVDVDLAPIRARLGMLETKNRRVRENAARAEAERELSALRDTTSTLAATIKACDEKKAAAIQGAKYPVDGLSVNEIGVLLDGFPIEQASHAERLKVGVAMGAALNPRLRVMLVREGSTLDDDNLRLLAELAHEQGVQVILERVGGDGAAGVLIEDGAIAGAEQEEDHGKHQG